MLFDGRWGHLLCVFIFFFFFADGELHTGFESIVIRLHIILSSPDEVSAILFFLKQ